MVLLLKSPWAMCVLSLKLSRFCNVACLSQTNKYQHELLSPRDMQNKAPRKRMIVRQQRRMRMARAGSMTYNRVGAHHGFPHKRSIQRRRSLTYTWFTHEMQLNERLFARCTWSEVITTVLSVHWLTSIPNSDRRNYYDVILQCCCNETQGQNSVEYGCVNSQCFQWSYECLEAPVRETSFTQIASYGFTHWISHIETEKMWIVLVLNRHNLHTHG